MSENPSIPVLDLTPGVEALAPELRAAFDRVLASGQFILGPEVETFEHEVAAYLGVRHAVGVNSGTDALVIALRALGIGPGDEVITTAFSFFATAESISAVGAKPVFVDIDPATYNLDVTLLEDALTPRTKAILPVHLYGLPCDMRAVLAFARAHDLVVVEDCAQSFGARHEGSRIGTLGEAGAYSFFPSKNLGGLGDGGLIATDRDDVAQTARALRAHGSIRKYQNEMLGYNSRLDALQAALLRVKLPHVDAWNAARARAAHRYDALLAGVDGIVTPTAHEEHVYHQYTIRSRTVPRDALAQALRDRGIGTMVYYPIPMHRLPVYAPLAWPPLPVSEAAAEEVLSLPMGPHLTSEQQDRVASAVIETVGAYVQ